MINLFLKAAPELAITKQYAAPYLVALGLLLNRTPFYAGPDCVVPSVQVERAFEALSDLDWCAPELAEVQTLFLRAGRSVDDPIIDLPRVLRQKIGSKLAKSGVADAKLGQRPSFIS